MGNRYKPGDIVICSNENDSCDVHMGHVIRALPYGIIVVGVDELNDEVPEVTQRYRQRFIEKIFD